MEKEQFCKNVGQESSKIVKPQVQMLSWQHRDGEQERNNNSLKNIFLCHSFAVIFLWVYLVAVFSTAVT